jgi:hypothetical protein
MIRTQIQIEEKDLRSLKALAAQRSTSVSQLVREGVGQVLEDAESERRWQLLMEVVGAFSDRERACDVAQRHDAYLAETYADE